MNCKNCGAELDPELTFCTECGAKQEPETAAQEPQTTERVCPACGAQAEAGVVFCTECGVALDAAAPAAGGQEQGQGQAPAPAGRIFCINCGASIPVGSAFCTGCGTPVGGAVSPRPTGRTPAGKASVPRKPITVGKGGKKLIAVVAGVAAVAVVAVAGTQLLGSISPQAAVAKAFAKTAKEFESAGQQMAKDIVPLNIIKGNTSQANTQSFEFKVGSAGEAMGSFGYMLEGMSPKLTIESDYAGKLFYANASVMGGTYSVCARDSLVGVSAPIVFGDNILTVDTKTLGQDLNTSPLKFNDMWKYNGEGYDLAELSFTLFDKPEELLKTFLGATPISAKDYEKTKADLDEILKTAVADLEVGKGEKVEIDFADGKTVKGKEYEITITSALQKKVLTSLVTSFSETEWAKGEIVKGHGKLSDFADMKQEIQTENFQEYTALVTVDNKGRLVGISAEIAPQLGILISVELRLNAYEALANDIELVANVSSPYATVKVSLTSVGNHTGKGGEFADTTQLRLTEGGQSMTASLNTEYTAAGELTSIVSMSVPGIPIVSVDIGAEVKAEKSAKSVSANFDRLNVNMDGMGSGSVSFALKYDMRAGVSDKAKKFFEKGTKVMVLKSNESELYTIFANVPGQAMW